MKTFSNDSTSKPVSAAPTDLEEMPFSLGSDAGDPWGNAYRDEETDLYQLKGDTFRQSFQRVRFSDGTPEVLVKFGHPQMQYQAHHLEFRGEAYGRYYKCLGDDCPACAAVIKAVTRRIDFFYSLETGDVVYYEHTPDRKPKSFASKLARACQGGYPAVLLITRDQYDFDIQRVEPPADLGVNTAVVKGFIEAHRDGEVVVDDFLSIISHEEMLEVPKIKNISSIKRLV